MKLKSLPLLRPVATLALVGSFLQPIAAIPAIGGDMKGVIPPHVMNLAEVTVTGTVISSEDGAPIPGVSVTIVGTSKGTITDLDGKYSLTVDEGQTLKFSYLGYTPQSVEVGSQTVIDITLEQDAEELSEVVVTAFGIEKDKKSLGYAVQKVDGEELTAVKASPSAVSNLKGRVAGVNITESGSGPGSGVRVIIRGNNSLTQSNQPLYVVDGIPMDNSSTNEGGDMYTSTNTGSGISDLNPDDIESMTVLKGPNAAALYGSRAANGVIMITTKKGTRRQGVGVDFSSSTVFSNPMLLPEFQNEYGQGTAGRTPSTMEELRTTGGSWGGKLDGSEQLYWDGTTKPYSPQPDNVKNFFNTGGNFVNTVALTGGNEKVTARFSYTNTYNEAMVENSFLNRNNFNLRATAKLSSKLSLDAKATYTNQFTRNRVNQGSEGLLAGVYSIPRNAIMDDFRDYRNEQTGLVRNYAESAINPYWTLNYDKSEDTRNRFLGFAKIQYQFTDWLSAHARVGTDWTDVRFESATQPGHWFYPDGRVGFSNNRYQETNADFLFMIDKQITQKLRLTANVGGNHLQQLSQGMSLNGQNLRIPTKTTIGSAGQVNYSAGVPTERVTNSFYASASFDYAGVLFLDITGRNDWTSTLPSDNWSYFYPSVNLALMVSEFIDPDQTFMDYLKVRGSWASVGKDASAWSLQNSYSLKNINNSYLGITTLTIPSIWYDQNLSPEFTKTYEVGLEGSFFKDRLFFDFAYYDISSTDLIDIVETANLAVNPLGRAEVHTNVGEITNKGIEVMLGGKIIENQDLTWNANVNFSHNKNELKEFLPDAFNRQWNVTNDGAAETRATVGSGYGEIWATEIRTNPETGDWILTANGMPQATGQRVKVGDFQPDYLMGFNNSFDYKNFNLRFLIDGRFGGEMFAATQQAMDGAGISQKTLQYREDGIIVDGVIENADGSFSPNTQSITAQQYWGAMSGIGANYIMDQTNVRLRELSLTYRIPSSFLGNSIVRSASISFIGRNLFFFYKAFDGGFDPESTLGTSNAGQGYLYYAMPTARSLGFNLNVKF